MWRYILILSVLFSCLFTQDTNDEFRATWVITWDNMDSNPDSGIVNIQRLMDDHVEANMNAVLYQVRQGGTAYYNSSFEPWGSYVGYQDPGYDPLAVAIEEAHARGLELHAWFNTFQAASTYPGAPAAEHPEWVCRDQDNIPMDAFRALSPGLEEVREYTLNVAMEIVNNYDIDGLHLDYIRWNEYDNDPRAIPSMQEQESALDGFLSPDDLNEIENNRAGRYLYDINHPYDDGVPAGYNSWPEWWRSSVTEFVMMLHDSIQAVKPYVRLSAAALGNYNWGGWQGYDHVYQDAALWYNEGYIDQLTPMHYHWDSGTEFLGMLINDSPNCWYDYIQDGIADERIFSVGPATYLIEWEDHEDIVEACRTLDWVKGYQFFSWDDFDYFNGWGPAAETFFSKNTKIPETNSDLSVAYGAPTVSGSKINDLTYELTVTPSDISENAWHILYRSGSETLESSTDQIAEIVFGNSEFTITDEFDGTQNFNGQYHYYATQANRFWKESLPSNTFISDSIPSYPPVVLSTTPNDMDTIDVTVDPIIHFSKTMNTQDAYNYITISPDLGHNIQWSNGNKTAKINIWYNLDYNTGYIVDISSSITDVNGVALDGNADGTPGDDYSFQFQTVDQDIYGPTIIGSTISENATIDIGELITVTFDEEVMASTLTGDNILLTTNGSDVEYDDVHSVHNSINTTFTIRHDDGNFSANTEYTLSLLDGITDVNGNAINPMTIDFMSEPYSYSELTYIDRFSSQGEWWEPNGSGSTTGILAGTDFSIDTDIYIPGTLPQKSARLDYVWDTSASSWLLREYLSGGAPRDVHFDTSYTLECYIYGDGSHNYFRFCVDDGASFGGHEVSPWVEIDWIGWKLITWDLGEGELGTWIGNGELNGTLRTDSFQMTYNPDVGISEGAIFFDDYRITQKVHDLDVKDEKPILPNQMALYQNYPNPFNPSTQIRFNLKEDGLVTFNVFDIRGRKVRTLLNNYTIAGTHTITWNGTDSFDQPVSSGMYLGRLESGGHSKTIQMIYMK